MTNCDKSEWIDKYVSAGYSLFQLKGKHPVKGSREWQKTPYDPLLEASDLPRNYGVVLKEDDLVIDVDPRNFVVCKEGKLITASGKPFQIGGKDVDPAVYGLSEGESDNPLQRLLQDAGMPNKPQTFTTKTGGGGLHIWLKKPAGFPHRMTLDKYPGIEFKAKGHFLVGPGSIHPDTKKTYTVIRFGPSEIIDAPEELLALIQRDDSFVGGGLDEASDDDGAKHRYITFLKNAPAAIEGCQGDLTTYKTAAMGRDFGLSFEVVLELMAVYWNIKCQPSWSPEELRVKVKNAFSYAQQKQGALHPEIDFAAAAAVFEHRDPLVELEEKYYRWTLGPGNKPKSNDLGNTANYFLTPDFETFVNPLYRLLRYNEFSDQIEFNFPAPWHNAANPQKVWTDTDAIQLKYWLSQEKHYVTNVNVCHEAAVTLATTLYRYHPIKKYLENLVWDGRPRLDKLLSLYAGAVHNPYTQAVGKNALIAAVARVYEPGCQFDHILILEGKQGTGKSSFVRVLGGAWYKDIVIDPHNKDTIDAMKGGWIIEASEMEFARRADIQALKAFITRVSDFVRPAYARTTRDFPRSCVIIGTINPEIGGGYLRDTTGNRRFWPVETGTIMLEQLKDDRDQLWAEAVHRYHQGEKFYLDTEELVAAAEVEQAARTAHDPWIDVIADWQHKQLKLGTLPDIVNASQVGLDALNLSARNLDRNAQVRIGQALVLLGWERGKFYNPQTQKSGSGYRSPHADEEWL